MSTKPKEGKFKIIIKILKLGTLFLEPAEHYYGSNAPNKPDVEMYAGEVSFFRFVQSQYFWLNNLVSMRVVQKAFQDWGWPEESRTLLSMESDQNQE